MKNKEITFSRQKYGIIESGTRDPEKIYPISSSQFDIGEILSSDFESAMKNADRNHPVGLDLNPQTLDAIQEYCMGQQIKIDQYFGKCINASQDINIQDKELTPKNFLKQIVDTNGYERVVINTKEKNREQYTQVLEENGFDIQATSHNSKSNYLEPSIPTNPEVFHTFLTEYEFETIDLEKKSEPIKKILYFGLNEYIVPDPILTQKARTIVNQKSQELLQQDHPLNVKIKDFFEEGSRDGGVSVTIGISDESGFSKDDLVELYHLIKEKETKYRIIYQKKDELEKYSNQNNEQDGRSGFIVLVNNAKIRHKNEIKISVPGFIIKNLIGKSHSNIDAIKNKLGVEKLEIERY